MTFMDGFMFGLGRMVAEASIGLAGIVVVVVLVAICAMIVRG